ncbi:MAG: ATP-binding cassette domain-containing protein [Oligoflexia bacterium]|nr:ATP-binding cassette domain-containing protein [Oligoflexia bacterium]
MIQLQSVSKSYFGEEQVLHQVSLEIKKGEFLYVLGGSGAGKSSLLRMLATEEAPSSGQLSLFGYDLTQMTPSSLRGVRQSIGYIPQEIRLIPDLTVMDNVMLALATAGRRVLTGSQPRVQELLERMGLQKIRHKRAALLSGGEAQRVAVVRALVRNPDLIVADEPTGAQDRDYTWAMMELFFRANAQGATVVLATHDREIVRRVRKRCAILSSGQLSFDTWNVGGQAGQGEAPCFY